MKPDGKLLTIPEFKGMSTNPPRGTVLAPELLLNAHLDRQGGYTPMYARSRRLSDVTRALTAGRADNLFVQTTGNLVRYWDAQAGTLTPIPGADTAGIVSLANTVNIMPDVLLVNGGATWLTTKQTRTGLFVPGTVSDTGTPTLKWEYVDRTSSTEPFLFDAAIEYTILIEWIPTKEYPFSGVTSFTVGAGVGTPPTKFSLKLEAISAGGNVPRFNIYGSQSARPPALLRSNYDTTAAPPQYVSLVDLKGVQALSNPGYIQYPWLSFNITAQTATTYHKGRAFIAPISATYYEINTDGLKWDEFGTHTLKTDTEPTRLYFSEITADGRENLPQFSLLNFIDVPFRVSRRIVALASVGPYLYIFGDRELLILTGDPATDGTIESVGDSIGAVSASSVQQLSGTVFWQSDSGVLAVTGAQVREVGGEVRDVLTQLGLGVSTTVDFRREQYVITDGVTMLSYHAREGGWTQRAIESGGTPSLIYGGGTPYMQQGTTLYSIGGETGLDGAPGRLQMRVRWPRYELGDWLHRKTFGGIAFGVDLATSSAYLTNLSTVDASTQLESDAAVTVTPGNRGVKLHTVDKDRISLTGVTISVEVTMDTGDSRGIMRPPLVVYGDLTSDEDWSDNGI